MSKLLDGLNPSQQKAVTHETGPLLIIAGPGSGKTRTVVHSIAYAIENWVIPEQILAFSFTVKASQELKERVTESVGKEKGQLVEITTFHSFCRKVLKEDIGRLHRGDALNFQDLDEDEQEKADQRRVAQAINDLQYESVKLEDVHNFIIKCKLGVLPSKAGNSKYAEIYDRYEQRLKKDGWIDYPNQLLFTDEIFRDVPTVKKKWQKKFDLIFVDEYQDTDPVQYRIIKALAEKHQNVRVVGDDDQGIYGWRGADIQNILKFERDFERHPNDNVISLGQNYRSTQRIVETSRALAEFNPDRRDKELFTRNLEGEKVKHLHCENDDVEANTIAKFISRSIEEGRDPNDFAVLYRTKKQAEPFETAFKNFKIPFHEVKKSSDRDAHGVSIMTIHKSKGLEFPNVFVVGVCKDLLPNYYSRDEKDWGEELRLLYVAMTRAKNWLCLSSYDYDEYRRGQSPFLERGYIAASLLESVETLNKTDTPPIPEQMIVQNAVEQSDASVESLPISSQTVIGIDPGNIGANTTNVGWSVTQKSADGYSVLCFDTENPEGTPEDRLQEIKETIDALIAAHSPAGIAVEKIEVGVEATIEDWFLYVAGCVATIRSIADQHEIECHLYTPQQVKYIATSNRDALKKDVQHGVKRVCNLPQIPEPHHSADAIAASLCYLRSYLNSSRFEGNKRKQEHYEAGCDYLDKKQYETAVDEFKETINIDPIYTAAHCDLAQAYLGQDKLIEAEKAVNGALRLEDDNPSALQVLENIKQKYYGRGMSYLEQDDLVLAEESTNEILRLDPKYQPAHDLLEDIKQAHVNRGKNYLEQDELVEAERSAREAQRLDPNSKETDGLLKAIKQAYYNRGHNPLENRQYDEAITAFKETINKYPKFTKAHCGLGQAYLGIGNLAAAEKSAREALKLENDYQPALQILESIKQKYYEFGTNYFNQGDLVAADNSADEALRLDLYYQPTRELLEAIKQAYYNRGQNYLNNRQYDEAITAFEETINRYPKFTKAHCGLGQAYLGIGNLAAAEKSAREALKLEDDYQSAFKLLESIKQKHYELGRDYLNQDDLAKAEKSANHALRLAPNCQLARALLEDIKQAYYNRGCEHLDNQRYDEAIDAFTKTKNKYPDFTEAHYRLAQAYFGQEDLAKAEKSAREALKLEVNYQPALQILKTVKQKHYKDGMSYLERGNLTAAERSANEALRLKPDYPLARALLEDIKQAYYNRGCEHLDNQRYDEAIDTFTKTKNKYPDFAEVHYRLAQAYLEQGDGLAAAEESVKETLRLDPNYQPAHVLLEDTKQEYHNRGIARIEIGEYIGAIDLLLKVNSIDPNNKEVCTNLADVYCLMGDDANAASWYQKVTDIDPNDKIAYIELGNAYYNMGKYEKAVDSFEKASKLDPNCEKTSDYWKRADFKLQKDKEMKADRMIRIPAGEFQMGSNGSESKNCENLAHTIYVDEFYIDINLVTNAQYKVFVDKNPEWQKNYISNWYHRRDYLMDWNGNNYPQGKDNHPVTYVDWYAAMAYALWVRKRLSTEVEWEKAAREFGDTVLVGNYPPDNASSVWEWCLDGYNSNSYRSFSCPNPIVGADNTDGIINNFKNVTTERVLRRGGSIDRRGNTPSFTNYHYGFRCAKTVTD